MNNYYYNYNNGYVYNNYGYGKACGTPTRETRRCTEEEGKYWDRLEKACREADRRK